MFKIIGATSRSIGGNILFKWIINILYIKLNKYILKKIRLSDKDFHLNYIVLLKKQLMKLIKSKCILIIIIIIMKIITIIIIYNNNNNK